MKLYIKQEVAAAKNIFTVYDELLSEKYYVRLEAASPAIKIGVLNSDEITAATVTKLPVLDAFSIMLGKNRIGLLQNGEKCSYIGVSRRIRGDVLSRSFDILEVDGSVIATHIRRYSQPYSYELTVFDEALELFSLCTAICIDIKQYSDGFDPVAIG